MNRKPADAVRLETHLHQGLLSKATTACRNGQVTAGFHMWAWEFSAELWIPQWIILTVPVNYYLLWLYPFFLATGSGSCRLRIIPPNFFFNDQTLYEELLFCSSCCSFERSMEVCLSLLVTPHSWLSLNRNPEGNKSCVSHEQLRDQAQPDTSNSHFWVWS